MRTPYKIKATTQEDVEVDVIGHYDLDPITGECIVTVDGYSEELKDKGFREEIQEQIDLDIFAEDQPFDMVKYYVDSKEGTQTRHK